MPNAQLITNTYLSVEHMQPDSSNANKEGYVADIGLAAVPVNLQPTSSYVTALQGGAYGKLYTVYTTNSGILETDRVTTVSGSSSVQYIVKGKQNFNYALAQHVELFVEEVE